MLECTGTHTHTDTKSHHTGSSDHIRQPTLNACGNLRYSSSSNVVVCDTGPACGSRQHVWTHCTIRYMSQQVHALISSTLGVSL